MKGSHWSWSSPNLERHRLFETTRLASRPVPKVSWRAGMIAGRIWYVGRGGMMTCFTISACHLSAVEILIDGSWESHDVVVRVSSASHGLLRRRQRHHPSCSCSSVLLSSSRVTTYIVLLVCYHYPPFSRVHGLVAIHSSSRCPCRDDPVWFRPVFVANQKIYAWI